MTSVASTGETNVCIAGRDESDPLETVSLLMALHAGAKPSWVAEALESVCLQTRAPDEVVLVADGPLPRALEDIIATYAGRLVLHRVSFPENCGLGKALAEGLRVCHGSLVARMDADDVAEAQRLEKQIACFRHNPELAVLGTQANVIDGESRITGTKRMPVGERAVRDQVWACPFIHPSVMFRRDRILHVGNYNENLRTRQDHELWYRCVAAGLRMRNIDEPLLRYREVTPPKNQRLKVVLQHVWINWRGCWRLRLGVRAWAGSIAPLVLFFLPPKTAGVIRERFKFMRYSD